MILGAAPIRTQDAWGSGEWGASRDGGKRQHRGVDYCFWPGTLYLSPMSGTVTKLGYAYPGDLTRWQYVEVSQGPYRARFFYLTPSVAVSQAVRKGDPLGAVEDLRERYPKISPHVHISLWRGDQRLNPDLEIDKIG